MGTKINNLRHKVVPDGIMLSTWLISEGITRAEQSSYTKRDTLKRVSTGVYKFPETVLSLYGILTSYNEQGTLYYHLGATTALEIRGFSHYITMGKQRIFIYTPLKFRLPDWIKSSQDNMEVIELSTKVFGEYGIERIEYEGYNLIISSPERAIMECILLSPKYFNIMDTYYLMEMLTNLRSKLLQELLENCTSVKVKRMFLYMAKKAKHRWFEKLDISKIDLGSGPRSYSTGGVRDSFFNIVIPKELVDYE